MNTTAALNPFPSLWMKNKTFDLFFFQLSGVLCLLLLLPYVVFGSSVIFPIYNFYLVFFGLPHNYMTWATLLPESSRKTFHMEPIYFAAIACLIVVLLIPLTTGTEFNDWILSLISYYSFWHAYRQHHGICKVYDAIQAKRYNDYSIFSDRKPMNLFFGLAANAVLVWAFTHPKIKYLLSADEFYQLIYPQVPENIYYLYLTATAVVGIWALKTSIWNRRKQGKFIPWPQLILMITAVATYIVPYFFISLEAMPLAVAIGTIYHNIQYFGFVWLFEQHRSREQMKNQNRLSWPQKLVYERSWVKYFSVALMYSFVVVTFYLVAPHQAGLSLIYFLGFAHYVIDGYIWKKDNNRLLNPVVNRISAVESPQLLRTA
jgi:hypothetical protein